MKNKLTSVIAIIGLALAGAGAWWWQNQAGAPTMSAETGKAVQAPPAKDGPGGGAAKPVAVEVGKAQRQRLVEATEAVGTLRSVRSVVLRPEVSGRVMAIGFRDGARVRKGQLLVQLDDTLLRAQLRQAQAQAGIARTQVQRNRDLAAQNFVSSNAVDQSAAALEVAQAQVAVVQAQIDRMRLLAPFDGVAGIGQLVVGDFVRDGAELARLEDTSRLWVDYRMPERDVTRVRPGLEVEVVLDAVPGRRFSGRVVALDAQVDSDGRALLVRAQLDNPGGLLKPGMFARTRTTIGARDEAIVVPEAALVPQGGEQYLIKVVDGPKGKVSERLRARLGARMAGKVEILEGVADGDTVVVAGQERLMRGEAQAVRIVQIGAAPAGKAAGPAAAGSDPAASGGASAPRPAA